MVNVDVDIKDKSHDLVFQEELVLKVVKILYINDYLSAGIYEIYLKKIQIINISNLNLQTLNDQLTINDLIKLTGKNNKFPIKFVGVLPENFSM